MVHNSPMRVRLVLVLAIGLVAVVAAGAVLALWGGGPHRAGIVTTSVADLAVGHSKAITVALPDRDHDDAHVFLVRPAPDDVLALLAVSTHKGCRVFAPDDADGPHFIVRHSSRLYFEDPCGGSIFALDGDCTGGPCPRGLDRYAVKVRGDEAEVDLRHLIKGPARGT